MFKFTLLILYNNLIFHHTSFFIRPFFSNWYYTYGVIGASGIIYIVLLIGGALAIYSKIGAVPASINAIGNKGGAPGWLCDLYREVWWV